MTDQEAEEQITLYAPDFDKHNDDVTLNNVTNELSQVIPWKEQQKLFRIFDDKYLNVNEKDAKVTTSFNINLTLLDASPARKRIINFKYLFIGLLLLSIAWLTSYLIQIRATYFTHLYMYAVVALSAAAGAIVLVYMLQRAKNTLVFYTENGRVPIVELFFRNPDKASFQQFSSHLINCINKCKAVNYFTDSQTLAAEMSEHRRLRDEGIISNEAYEKAKNRIFASHSSINPQQADNT